MKNLLILITIAFTFALGSHSAEARMTPAQRTAAMKARRAKLAKMTPKQRAQYLARKKHKKKHHERLNAENESVARTARPAPRRVAKARKARAVDSTGDSLNDVIKELDQIDWNSAEVAGLDPGE